MCALYPSSLFPIWFPNSEDHSTEEDPEWHEEKPL